MTTNPRTGKAVRKYVQDVPGKLPMRHLARAVPEFTYDQVAYWARWLKPVMIGRRWYYDESDVLTVRYMAALILHLDMTPSSAAKVAKKLAVNGLKQDDKVWVEVKGILIAVPAELSVA